MKKLTEERQGEAYIFSAAVLWGIFPVLVLISYNRLPPMISLSVSSLFAALFFGIILIQKKKWKEIFNKKAFKDIFLHTFYLGILYYVFYFFALKYTSPGNVSIIALSEVFFSYLFFHVFKKNFIPKEHIIGAILMIAGAIIILYPNFQKFQIGDILVLFAAASAPIGNFYVQRARKMVTTETIMFLRSLISAVAIFALSLIFREKTTYLDLKGSLLFFVINGSLLLGLSKIFWIEGVNKISVTKAAALSSLAPLLTLFFAWIFLKTPPSSWQLLSFAPMFFGILLLGKDLSKHRPSRGAEN